MNEPHFGFKSLILISCFYISQSVVKIDHYLYDSKPIIMLQLANSEKYITVNKWQGATQILI